MLHRPAHLRWACWVTGTDTEIGKTLIASGLLHRLAQQGLRVAGVKAVAAGASLIDGQWCNEDVQALRAASTVDLPLALSCPYVLRTAVAPHIAAALEGVAIDPVHIVHSVQQAMLRCDALVVEGVGGFRVPLNASHDTADLSQTLGLPVVMVVGLRLGCINQALLTQEAIRARGLSLVGWVANSTAPDMPHEAENIETLRQRIDAPLLGHVPYLSTPSVAEAARFIALPF